MQGFRRRENEFHFFIAFVIWDRKRVLWYMRNIHERKRAYIFSYTTARGFLSNLDHVTISVLSCHNSGTCACAYETKVFFFFLQNGSII